MQCEYFVHSDMASQSSWPHDDTLCMFSVIRCNILLNIFGDVVYSSLVMNIIES